MIEGDGFFQVLMPDGNIGYSRNGQFTVNDEGVVVTSGAGYALEPEIAIPEDAIGITVGTDGEVSVRLRGQQDNQVIGQITTVDFINVYEMNSKVISAVDKMMSFVNQQL